MFFVTIMLGGFVSMDLNYVAMHFFTLRICIMLLWTIVAMELAMFGLYVGYGACVLDYMLLWRLFIHLVTIYTTILSILYLKCRDERKINKKGQIWGTHGKGSKCPSRQRWYVSRNCAPGRQPADL
jgi:hypothetical protein